MWRDKNSYYNKITKKHQFFHPKHSCPFFMSIILRYRKCQNCIKDRQNRTIICKSPNKPCIGKSTGWGPYNSFYNYFEIEDLKRIWGI